MLLLAPLQLAQASPKPASKSATKSATKSAAKSEAPKKSAKKTRRIAKAHPLKIPNSQVEPLAWHEMPGWIEDDHSEAFIAFLASCRPILKSSAKARAERGETYRALYDVCGRAMAALPLDDTGARGFFEQNFRPVKLTALGEKDGFFTGYYEPVVEGARYPSDVYKYPLYRRPDNLITQRIRRSSAKGKAGKKVVKRSGAPYFDRTQIEEGAIAGRDLEICWLKDPIDGFFAEIQGSVRVRLEDGKVIRLNYADKNGHPYFAVGSVLIQRGIVSKEEMSMQKIREYMEKFPEEGKELRRMNRSYVFFRETDLSEHDEAIGAQGISLTPARSIAVDRKLHTYGMPVFVNAHLPIASEKPDTWFRRLMVAQDTGGAIIGPARADIYLGAGTEAERAAGRFKHNGQFVLLVPNELDPADEALGMPLPQPRPKIEDQGLFAALKPQAKPETKPEAKPQAAPEAARTEPKPESKPAVAARPKVDEAPKPAAKPAAATAKPQAPAKPEPQAAPKPKTAAKPETPAAPRNAAAAKPDTRPEAKPDPQAKPKRAAGGGNPFPKPIGAAQTNNATGSASRPAAKPAPKPAQ